jgi:putative Mg2+ transporter-C (MgtC) family protein
MNIDTEFWAMFTFIAPKVLIATICGSIIGYEREMKNKVAGIRTNILICVGSAIFTSASFYISNQYGANVSDPTRIISTIVTGVGFLGGGAIMKSNEDRIVGLTTASFIWVMSAIGILAGMGGILTPIVLTIGLLFVSLLFEKVERYLRVKRVKKQKSINGENRN